MIKVLSRLGLIGLAFFLCVVNPSHAMGQASFMDFLESKQAGKPAQDFTLKSLSGQDLNMTKYRDGKNAIIFFWATWCPHCREALHELVKDKNSIESKGIKVILVNLGESVDEVRPYAQHNNVTYDIFMDTDSSLGEIYGLIGVPTFFFVNQQGIIKAIEHGMPENLEQIFSQ